MREWGMGNRRMVERGMRLGDCGMKECGMGKRGMIEQGNEIGGLWNERMGMEIAEWDLSSY